MTDQQILNTALMSIPSRSEKNEQAVLIDTFVEAGTLFKRLSSVDNQIIYGRRGTGKTHTLQYLASQRNKADDVAIYCDLNALGSAASVYSDATLTVPNRATTLLRDLLLAMLEEDEVLKELELARQEKKAREASADMSKRLSAFLSVILSDAKGRPSAAKGGGAPGNGRAGAKPLPEVPSADPPAARHCGGGIALPTLGVISAGKSWPTSGAAPADSSRQYAT